MGRSRVAPGAKQLAHLLCLKPTVSSEPRLSAFPPPGADRKKGGPRMDISPPSHWRGGHVDKSQGQISHPDTSKDLAAIRKGRGRPPPSQRHPVHRGWEQRASATLPSKGLSTRSRPGKSPRHKPALSAGARCRRWSHALPRCESYCPPPASPIPRAESVTLPSLMCGVRKRKEDEGHQRTGGRDTCTAQLGDQI